MGYALCLGSCYSCGKTFSFNPVIVPSFRDKNGVRQPLCRECMTAINEKRKTINLEPFEIHPAAYEFCDEEELE